MKRYWKEKSHNNHWLDASYRASCAAAMCGIPAVWDAGDDHNRGVVAAGIGLRCPTVSRFACWIGDENERR